MIKAERGNVRIEGTEIDIVSEFTAIAISFARMKKNIPDGIVLGTIGATVYNDVSILRHTLENDGMDERHIDFIVANFEKTLKEIDE